MRHLLPLAILFLAASAPAQTTVDITTPSGLCSYATGPVTTGAPGHLEATATSSTGAGCGTSGSTGNVSFGPAEPLTPASQSIGNSTGGNPASISFQAVNATSCTASISGASGGTFTGGVVTGIGTASATVCNSSSSCQAVQSPQMNFPYNSSTTNDITYTVSATCTGTGGNANSTATITVPHGTSVGSCYSITNSAGGSFTQQTGQKSVNCFGSGPENVDITNFAAVWKKNWPGSYGLNCQFTLPTANYISLAFSTPSAFFSGAGAPSPVYGDYTIGSGTSGYSTSITMTISTKCGDFANPATNPSSTVVSGCYTNKGGPGSLLQWRGNTRCILSDNTQYYFNIINADVTNVTANGGGTATSTKNSNCSASTCNDPIEDGPGTWSSWTGTSW